MKLPCSNQILKNYKLCARLSIVSAFILFFFSLSSRAENDAAIASIQDDVSSILQSLNWALKNPTSGSSGRIPEQLDDLLEYDQVTYKFLTGRTSTSQNINYNDKNALPYLLGSLVYGLTGWAPNSSQPLNFSLHGDLTTGNETLLQLLSLLQNISNVVAQSANTVVVSNYVSVTNTGFGGVVSPDILAGNPWWSTNSAFVLAQSNLGLEYPHDRMDNAGLLSFPEFLSVWSSRLSAPQSRPVLNGSQWSWWGSEAYPANGSISEKVNRSYTWFDFAADVFKSNLLADATYSQRLLSELRVLSNALASVSSSVFVTNNTYVSVTNSFNAASLISFLDQQFGNQFSNDVDNAVFLGSKLDALSNVLASSSINITNVLNAPDILAGNPWWYTNSSFAAIWPIYLSGGASPSLYHDVRNPLTFPEAISFFLSSRTFDGYLEPRFSLWTRWGENGQNYREGKVFTFEDFLADYLKSNLVLTSVSSYSNLLSDASSTGATMSDDDETVETNELDVLSIHKADTSAIGDLTSVVDSMGIEDAFSGVHVSSANPVLRIFDGGQYGSVRVAPVDADFSLPPSVANLMKSISKWLWRLLCVVSIFCIVRQEFDFWSTLGGSASA